MPYHFTNKIMNMARMDTTMALPNVVFRPENCFAGLQPEVILLGPVLFGRWRHGSAARRENQDDCCLNIVRFLFNSEQTTRVIMLL